MTTPGSSSRRDLLKGAAMVGAGFWVGTRGAWSLGADGQDERSPNEKLNIGLIGVMGRAEQSYTEENNAVAKQNIVAICDVDEQNLSKAAERFGKAQRYTDFRKMLERNDLDAVMVTTADHTHAAATLMALNSGKHVYCEKPLTHTVEEARWVTEAAVKNKRVTQMGTQIHAGSNYRRVVELVQGGAIGKISEVHVFLDKAWSYKPLSVEEEPPKHLNYDLWLGPVQYRGYHREYHPAAWRRYWAFGNGTLGDMGCHYIDLVFWALKLKYPERVSVEGPAVNAEGYPEHLTVHWTFPAEEGRGPVKLTWYDGGHRPEAWSEWDLKKEWKTGVMFMGDKGMLFADYNNRRLLPQEQFKDFKAPEPTIPESIGHHREWLAACKKNDPTGTTCHFGYSGPLTETVLLGCVAHRAGTELQWDWKNLRATNAPEADRYIRGEYRKGWFNGVA